MPFLSTDPIGPMLRKWTYTDQEQVRIPAAAFAFFIGYLVKKTSLSAGLMIKETPHGGASVRKMFGPPAWSGAAGGVERCGI